jgi:UDP-3-O-[3-hydroxymyristoyl] glucosamine N-acyltransferase
MKFLRKFKKIDINKNVIFEKNVSIGSNSTILPVKICNY